MGACKYCGESAGFLRREHKECRLNHEAAAQAVRMACIGAALYGEDLDGLRERIRSEWAKVGVAASQLQIDENIAEGWGHALADAMEDRMMEEEERLGLNRYRSKFRLSETVLDREGDFQMFRMASLIGSIIETGQVPRGDRKAARQQFGRVPFNLMKSEALVWLFHDVGYGEQITRREFTGSSMGMSFRVARGVYVRPGRFKGKTVTKTSMERTDDGILGITTKHIYFAGSEKRFRVRLEKIVSFEPYADGLGIMRDTARAKPEIFLMPGQDAWAAVNLIDALLDADDPTPSKKDGPTLDDIVDEGLDDDEDDATGMFAAGMSSG